MKIKVASLLFIFMLLMPTPVYGFNDGAYLVTRTTSYVNPLTGQTEDGGTNITLGDSMVSNIVENQLLIEQTGEKYYITIGLGLASNVKNVRFKIMNSLGTFSSVGSSQTGSSSANGDTVNHYRIQVSSLDVYISPIIYVSPMARDVQFFIKPHIESATPGTGIYKSQMIPSNQNTSSTEAIQQKTNNETSTKNTNSVNKNTDTVQEQQTENQVEHVTVGTISKESLLEGQGLKSYLFDQNGKINTKLKLTQKNLKKSKQESKQKSFYYEWLIGVVLVIMGGIIYVKKIKK